MPVFFGTVEHLHFSLAILLGKERFMKTCKKENCMGKQIGGKLMLVAHCSVFFFDSVMPVTEEVGKLEAE